MTFDVVDAGHLAEVAGATRAFGKLALNGQRCPSLMPDLLEFCICAKLETQHAHRIVTRIFFIFLPPRTTQNGFQSSWPRRARELISGQPGWFLKFHAK